MDATHYQPSLAARFEREHGELMPELCCPVCRKDDLKAAPYDNGIDPDTGYHDVGVVVTCLDCGHVTDEREHYVPPVALPERRRPVMTAGIVAVPAIHQKEVA